MQATLAQATQELRPEVLGLGVPDRRAKDLAAPVSTDTGGDHHSLGDHPPADAGLAVVASTKT
jgi:hypothetical protein